MSGRGKAEPEGEEAASGEAVRVVRVLLVGCFVAAALAANHFVLHSALLTNALLRRLFF